MPKLTRLHETIAAVCPIDGVSGGTQGNVTIQYAAGATAPQRAAADAALASFDWSDNAQTAWDNLKDRATAQELIDSVTSEAKALRAVVSLLVDELNTLRQWITDFKTATAGAGTLAQFKTAVAALPNLPQRTLAQAKTAIQNAIRGGGAD